MDDAKTKEPVKLPPSLDLTYEELQGLTDDAAFAAKKIDAKRWLFETRLEYARNFFAHHAKQRMDAFNYFLVFVGFVFTAIANMYKDSHYGTASVIALSGALLTLTFIFLDRRNEELVHISEDNLEALESQLLFANFNQQIAWPRRRGLLGSMPTTTSVRPLGIFRRQTADVKGSLADKACPDPRNPQTGIDFKGESTYAHGIWMPRFQFAICLIFVALAMIPWRFWFVCEYDQFVNHTAIVCK